MILRDYQLDTIRRIEESLWQYGKVILVAPCGSGKTVMGAELIRRELENGGTVLFVAHRIELIKQTSAKLNAFNIEHGIIMAGFERTFMPDVQVASIQTFIKRMDNGRMEPSPATLIILDECHHAAAKSYVKILEHYPNAKVVGLTATPIRGDGLGLGGPGMFQDIVLAPTVRELIKMNHLVPLKYYVPSKPDLEKVKILAGDYNTKQLEKAMDQSALVGDIVENFARICPDRKAVVFCVGVGHSKHVRDALLGAGIIAVHIDAKTPKDERDDTLNRLASGEVQVVCNCMILTEGWDCPPVSCIILARPTKSPGLFLQMAGRGLRPCPEIGKTNLILIDHSGAVYEHGRVEEEWEWSLDPHVKFEGKPNNIGQDAKIITCQQCKFIYEGEPACPECGFVPVSKAKPVKVLEGDLHELDEDGELEVPVSSEDWEKEYYRQLKYAALQLQYKKGKGWAAHKFKDMFGDWPPRHWYESLKASRPGSEVLRVIGKRRNEFF